MSIYAKLANAMFPNITMTPADYEEQYQWFLGVALLLLIVEMLVLSRRNPLLRGVKLFDVKSADDNNTKNNNLK